MTSPSVLWWRTFVRSEANDIDTQCTPQFLRENFTDYFGQFLQQDSNASIFSLDALLKEFYDKPKYSFDIYCVADGAFIKHPEPSNPKSWFNPHVRFIAVVQPKPPGPSPWTLFIVGSNDLTSKERFLQVVSWDFTINEYRYYGKEEVQPGGHDPTKGVYGWVYQGRSSYAFNKDTTYLGPFDGHVNGALVMKELEKPWYHWKSGENTNLTQCLSAADIDAFKGAPYLSYIGILFSEVADANKLQGAVQNGIIQWYNQRSLLDFPEPRGNPNPKTRAVKRWMAHVLLTTTVNISVAAVNPNLPGKAWFPPVDHFINNAMLKLSGFSDLLPQFPVLAFIKEHYDYAVSHLRLSLIQENTIGAAIPGYQNLVADCGTLGGGKETDEHWLINFVIVKEGEGVPFVILQPSYEDAQGAQKMQMIPGNVRLLSEKTFNALMMLDICNPIYSWRRGVLMQYVPDTMTWNGATQTYDLEEEFVKAVQASPYAQDKDMPECQLLELMKADINTHKARISTYLQAVKDRLNTREGLVEYLELAESRRRIFRPLPLNEFGYTLPYAVNYYEKKPWEMRMDGMTAEMPDRGVEFITSWTKTLWGDNPKLTLVDPEKVGVRKGDVGAPDLRGAHIPCEGASRFRKTSGCPFAGSGRTTIG